MAVQILADAGVEENLSNLFLAILSRAGFAEFAGVMAFTATLAAIMSTADSFILAVSHPIASEIIDPMASEAH